MVFSELIKLKSMMIENPNYYCIIKLKKYLRTTNICTRLDKLGLCKCKYET